MWGRLFPLEVVLEKRMVLTVHKGFCYDVRCI